MKMKKILAMVLAGVMASGMVVGASENTPPPVCRRGR